MAQIASKRPPSTIRYLPVVEANVVYSAMDGFDDNKAAEFWVEACNLYENDDQPRLGIDTFKKCINFFVRKQQYVASRMFSGFANY